jgi:NitT/TauT family transport system substrate-binding protein
MNTVKYQKLKLSLLACIACLITTSCNNEEHYSTSLLQVGTSLWSGYEPLYLARELDAWDERSVRLIQYPSSTETLRAFRNGSLDAASLTLDEALVLSEDQIPVWVVLIHNISNGGDVIMARPGIESVAQLSGNMIAVENNARGAFVITRALEMNDLRINDIDILPSQVNGHEELYLANAIDAAVTYEPMKTRLERLGANEIFSSQSMPGEIINVLVVRKTYGEQYPEKIQLLVNGWFNALEYIEQEPTQSSAIMSRRLSTTVSEIDSMFAGFRLLDLEQNQAMLAQNSGQLIEHLEALNRTLIENGLISSHVEIYALPNDAFVRTVE